MQHQDWDVVVFKKRQQQDEDGSSKEARRLAQASQTRSSTTNRPAWKIESMVDNAERLPRVSKTDAQAIAALRVKHKLTRAQLAQRVRMKESAIADIETGKALENKQHIRMILRALSSLNDAGATQS